MADFEITDLDRAIHNLEQLEKDIILLRGDLPLMQATIQQLQRTIQRTQSEMDWAVKQIELLEEKHETWTQFLASRLTLLLNLREWLVTNSQPPDEGVNGPNSDSPA